MTRRRLTVAFCAAAGLALGVGAWRATQIVAIGVAYKLLKRPKDALFNYTQALQLREKIGDKGGQASTLNELARVLRKAGAVEVTGWVVARTLPR